MYLVVKPDGARWWRFDSRRPDSLATLRRVEARGSPSVANRLRQVAGQIFRYAVATGRAERDPFGDLCGALKSPGGERHHAALTNPTEVGHLLRAIDGYTGSPVTRVALQLSPLLFVRPGELRAGGMARMRPRRRRVAHSCSKDEDACGAYRAPFNTSRGHPASLTGGGFSNKPDAPRYVFPGARIRIRPISNNTVKPASHWLRRRADDGPRIPRARCSRNSAGCRTNRAAVST